MKLGKCFLLVSKVGRILAHVYHAFVSLFLSSLRNKFSSSNSNSMCSFAKCSYYKLGQFPVFTHFKQMPCASQKTVNLFHASPLCCIHSWILPTLACYGQQDVAFHRLACTTNHDGWMQTHTLYHVMHGKHQLHSLCRNGIFMHYVSAFSVIGRQGCKYWWKWF